MNKQELIKKIIEKKEFSQLPEKDVELAFSKFEKKAKSEYQLMKLTRNFLRKIYSSFSSRTLFGEINSDKKFDAEWILMKHKSTMERYEYYDELYKRVFSKLNLKDEKEVNIFDFGCGVNGLTYNLMKQALVSPLFTQGRKNKEAINLKEIGDDENKNLTKTSKSKILFNTNLNQRSVVMKSGAKSSVRLNYLGVEAVGQLCDLVNGYFKKENLFSLGKAQVLHASLFDTNKLKELITNTSGIKIVFLFKVIDSLEVIERDYSKSLISWLLEGNGLGIDLVVVSFATKSLGSRKKFSVQRGWLLKFIQENFHLLDDFEVAGSGERYLVFEKR